MKFSLSVFFPALMLIWCGSFCCMSKVEKQETALNQPESLQTVTIEGTARNAALGAVIVKKSNEPVYIDGLTEWPPDALGKPVRAKGVLKEKKLAPDPVVDEKGNISHGMAGLATVLEKAEWSVVK
jgi:hypothetical protein